EGRTLDDWLAEVAVELGVSQKTLENEYYFRDLPAILESKRRQEAFDVFYRLGQIVIFERPFYELDDFVDTDFFSDILLVKVRQNSDDLNDLIRRQIEGGDYISVQVFARGEENLNNHSGKVFRNADNLFHLGDSQFRDFNYL